MAFPAAQHLVLIAIVAFIGTINPSGGDLGMLVPLEHAMLARGASDQERTKVFASYSLIGALSMAAGSLAASIPDLLVGEGFTQLGALRLMFLAYAALGIASALLYRRLPHARAEERHHAPLGPSRRTVYKLAALFSIDAFAGGFIAQSLLVLWLFDQYKPIAVDGRRLLLLVEHAELILSSGCRQNRTTLGSREHHGVHPYSVQRIPDPRAVRA